MTITEPTTMLTDYVLAGIAFILAGFLARVGWRSQQRSVCFWAAAFLFVAIAAALGGSCHGLVVELGASLSMVLWQLMLYAVSLASLFMLVGTVWSRVSQRKQRWFLLAAIVKLAITWLHLLHQPHFTVVAVDYLISMLLVLALQVYGLASSPRSASWLTAGILVSGLAMAVLVSGATLFQVLNHNDLYHLIQLVGLGILFQGAKRLKDQ
nr:MAG: hypothetical protein EDM05_01185 [Leptolyngbya sp. IPPAS B-1204]